VDAVFPEAPVPATATIQPIRNARELAREGHTMHHCVACYGQSVLEGSHYVYRVTAPERATLSIARRSDGSWGVSDLRRACNERVSPETEQAVAAWLRPDMDLGPAEPGHRSVTDGRRECEAP
jgi:hypothetical protein